MVIPAGLPFWLSSFLHDVEKETAILRLNGAEPSAMARDAVVTTFLTHARSYLDETIDVGEMAKVMGASKETVRRRVRDGTLGTERTKKKGHIRVRRGDVLDLAQKKKSTYDPIADAQDIAKLRRKA